MRSSILSDFETDERMALETHPTRHSDPERFGVF
jgi:hypothetical protein